MTDVVSSSASDGIYIPGINPDYACYFATNGLTTPQEIKLSMGLDGISWNYTIKHKVTDTYGGQVVQILGIAIENLVIRGSFAGMNPQWGEERTEAGLTPREMNLEWRTGSSITPYENGLRQMADWFRQYFEATTQGVDTPLSRPNEMYSEKAMKFRFPSRNWDITIRPTAFPSVIIDDETLTPQWVVEADFVEGSEGNERFVKEIQDYAFMQLHELRDGVGYERNNPFSDPLTETGQGDPVEQAIRILDGWEKTIWNNFKEDDIDSLIAAGYSIPTVVSKMFGGAEERVEAEQEQLAETVGTGVRAVTDELKSLLEATSRLPLVRAASGLFNNLTGGDDDGEE